MFTQAAERYQESLDAMRACGAHDEMPAIKEALKRVQEQQTLSPPPSAINDNPLSQGIELLTQTTAAHHRRAEMLLLSSVAKADEERDPKQRVLSRLALARLPNYQSAMIQQAMNIAQGSNDMNLITAVKKTMDQLNISIEPKVF